MECKSGGQAWPLLCTARPYSLNIQVPSLPRRRARQTNTGMTREARVWRQRSGFRLHPTAIVADLDPQARLSFSSSVPTPWQHMVAPEQQVNWTSGDRRPQKMRGKSGRPWPILVLRFHNWVTREDEKVPLIGRDDLILNKQATGRARDLLDIHLFTANNSESQDP